jgi:hypothetical protein
MIDELGKKKTICVTERQNKKKTPSYLNHYFSPFCIVYLNE